MREHVMNRLRVLLVAIVVVVLMSVAAFWGYQHETEFSPDLLVFRSNASMLGLKIRTQEWSTESLVEAREWFPNPVVNPPRWHLVHSRCLWFGNHFARGDASIAYTVFRLAPPLPGETGHNEWKSRLRRTTERLREADYEGAIEQFYSSE
jgi:hypothetical protein